MSDSGTAADSTTPDVGTIADTGNTADTGTGVLDGGASTSCVSVTGGGLEPWLDLEVVGREFNAHDDRRMRIVVSSDVGGRLGVADEVITDGAFELTMPATINYSYYTEIALYVDEDGDEACDVSEPIWGLVTGIVTENLAIEATPDGPCVNGGGPQVGAGCRSWLAPAGPCVVNGQTDLEKRLPCPP
jgi:hypothetical protein